MDKNWLLIFEIFGFATYFLLWAKIFLKKDFLAGFEMFAATIYGLLLEIGNIYFAHTYYYNPGFRLMIYGVPMVIGCGWAIIIYSIMSLNNRFKLNMTRLSLLDALSAMLLDVVIDPVAVHMGLWHWQISFNKEFFGVPYENLFAWLAVVFCFSFTIRYLRKSKLKKQYLLFIKIFSPLIAYVALLFILSVYGVLTIFPAQVLTGNFDFTLPPAPQNIYTSEAQIFKLIILLISIVGIILFIRRQETVNNIKRPPIISDLIIKGIFLFFIAASFFLGFSFFLSVFLIMIFGAYLYLPSILYL